MYISTYPGGLSWDGKSVFRKFLYLAVLITLAPLLCILYVLSPYRDHKVMFCLG
jgi:hypothetical protein